MSKIFINPVNVQLPADHPSLFEKLRPTNGKELLEKPSLEDMSKKAYLWMPLKEKSESDDYDRMFLDHRDDFNVIECYGYHSTGYALFFKPDLGEVIKIALDEIRNAKICFVTTEPCHRIDSVEQTAAIIKSLS